MKQKVFLIAVVLLMVGRLFANQELQLVTLSADGTETTYTLSNVQKIVFENNTMTVVMKSGSDATGITCISFSDYVGIENPKTVTSISVFPNPVQTFLTVAGADKNTKINLYDINGRLLKSIPAKDDSTEINVSSLTPGLYLLQVGEQVIKFIKQ